MDLPQVYKRNVAIAESENARPPTNNGLSPLEYDSYMPNAEKW